MNIMENNYEYYSDDSILNGYIDNIVLHKKYLEELLIDIKNGKINKKLIKKTSKFSEKFFDNFKDSDIESDIESDGEYVFKPMTKIVTTSSDTSDSDSGSVTGSIYGIQDISDDDELHDNNKYTSGKLKSELSISTYDNNSPNFIDNLDNYSKPTSSSL